MAQRYATLTFPDWPRDLKIGDELGRGAWGAVYNGELEGRPVAVKRIHELLHQGCSEEERRKVLVDFRDECKKLQTLSHPHVVGFIGSFTDPKLGPILVMEKMQENLRQFLNRWENKLPLLKQLRISLEIIRGVAFLHQQTPPLVHRDLNDKNVMFSFEGVIKIGDFGQSKLKKDLYLTSGQPGMVLFMPPEALKDHEVKYNESLDIFSVGVLMLEIGTQQEPLVNLCGIGVIREVERRERHLKALSEDHPLRLQILPCLKDNPKERPKASDLQREVLALVDGGVETRDERLTSEITTLRAALAEAREENASRREHEAKLQAECASLEQSLTHAVEECQARKQYEQILVQQMNVKLALEQNHLRELDNEKKANHELTERCEQLQLQVNAYEEDFKAERHDRESAHDKFADREKKWMEELETLTQEQDRLTGKIFTLEDQLVAGKRELEARTKEAAKVSTAVKALKEDFGTVLAKRDEEIQRMTDLIRGLQLIAVRYKVLSAENRELQHQFDAIMRTNHEVQQIPSGFHGEEAAAESQVKELSMVVGQVTAENEALAQQNEIGSSYKHISVAPTPLPRTKKPKRSSRNAGDRVNELSMVLGQVTAENEALTQQNEIGSSYKHISVAPTPRPRTKLPKEISMNPVSTGRGIHPDSVSTGPSTEDDLPMPLTRPGVMPPLQSYVREDIDSEIGHEAHHYKEDEKAKAAPVHVDDEEWPLDPNLTCPYCNVVFRRGQMREFRHHIDECR